MLASSELGTTSSSIFWTSSRRSQESEASRLTVLVFPAASNGYWLSRGPSLSARERGERNSGLTCLPGSAAAASAFLQRPPTLSASSAKPSSALAACSPAGRGSDDLI